MRDSEKHLFCDRCKDKMWTHYHLYKGKKYCSYYCLSQISDENLVNYRMEYAKTIEVERL